MISTKPPHFSHTSAAIKRFGPVVTDSIDAKGVQDRHSPIVVALSVGCSAH